MGDKVDALYDRMRSEKGLIPNATTFTVMITAWGHHGAVCKARGIWQGIGDQAVRYDILVISAMVDALARNGEVGEAYDLIAEYEMKYGEVRDTNNGMWMSLLSGCKQCGDSRLGKIVYDCMRQRFCSDSSYMQSASILAQQFDG